MGLVIKYSSTIEESEQEKYEAELKEIRVFIDHRGI